jgi:alkanesulfonate monooxygenase SsuD/methylene tetrahydromethanopterin reductase-like flavin-dependent oxidoreductase (luciferase family)
MAAVFQNTGRALSDRQVYLNELALADMAEPLGFESIWSVEHHFTDYTMCPDVVQFLSYMAGRTKHVRLGSMVVVLPWHDPERVAEQVIVHDHMSNGRLILGIGRGLGRIEFEGFGVEQGDSRAIFVEAAETLLAGLETGKVEYHGRFIRQAPRELRPRPFASFRGRTYAAAVSPESSEIMARLGIGVLIIPQKPWELVVKELDDYRAVFRDVNGVDAPPPVVSGWVFCDENAERAEECARRYIGEYYRSVIQHYELVGDHLTKLRGYEAYKAIQERISAEGGADEAIDFFLSLQVWGTPEQCHRKIVDTLERTGGDTFTGVFSYGAMPYDMAEQSLRLFARTVKPELKKSGDGV